MVAEKRFLKEIKRKNSSNSNDFLESINKGISSGRNWPMDQLECKREKAITNETVKGQSWWKFLGSKEEIQDKINVNEKRAEKMLKKRLENRSHIKCLIKKLKTIEKHVDSIESQMEQANRRKEKAYKRICLLIKQHEEKECCCFGHLSALKNVTQVVKRIFDLHECSDLKPELELRTEEILKMIGYRWEWSNRLKPPSLFVTYKDVVNGKVKKITRLEVPVRRWMDYGIDMSTGETVGRPVQIDHHYEKNYYWSPLK
ncbi:uncharacterized protein LOC130015742 [Mercurialis annua]|uniref:uncharacterized protein LOC130015742 n=1 Tax=Mercurialis annua TaxID=3986 RepID=UPI0024AD8E77|nr:uncharacterized protein LOC130015742 [Mercurialis annua]